MGQKPYPALQSGFLGLDPKALVLPDPIEPTVREAVIFKAFKPPLLTYFYSKEVTEIFNRWSANAKVTANMEFRERIIKAFFTSFGTKKFRDWLQVQMDSGQLSGLHQKFILETLEFALLGKPRKIESMQWINLLEAGPVTQSIRVEPEEFARTKKDLHSDVKIPNDLQDLAVQWLKQRQGFEDMLICLYVIFGARSRQTDVVDLGH